MSQQWDLYFCTVDNKPATTFVDLGIRPLVPMPAHSSMVYLRIYLKHPRPDGLPSNEEYASLKKLQDALETSLITDNSLIYVGRITSDGCRLFFFYSTSPADWKASVNRFMSAFPEYKYDCDTREDANWETYLKYLYPSDDELQQIFDRRSCETLKERGDALNTGRTIDHWAYFVDDKSRDDFAPRVEALGFSIRTRLAPGDTNSSYGLQFSRVDKPVFDNINTITFTLGRLAKKYNGLYAGWASKVVT